LNWALEGLRDYWQQGLNPPEFVVNATKQYRIESDLVEQWIQERCKKGEDAVMSSAEGYGNYTLWCENMGINKNRIISQIKWARKMQDKGYVKFSKNTGSHFRGIALDNDNHINLSTH
jgi:putative DNA primase/helicase